ncbi:MAG TPA: DUF6443 domain-containing protein, partial [Chitinophaga sp.]|uniref:DUF6443 domain-containing protein n=1 Tax=Chitinophaga sp. TaxID=1869181 RepID=UPI002B755C06
MYPFYPSAYWKLVSIIAVLFCVTQASAQNTPSNNTRPAAVPEVLPVPYTTTPNYIRTWEPSKPISDPAVTIDPNRTVSEVKQSTQYFDGMGRLIQTVNKGASGTGKDLVTPLTYDEYGREQFKYLPYVPQAGNTSDGNLKTDPFNSQRTFYQDNNLNPGAKGESIFYSQTDFELSPLNRSLGSYAAGNSWAKTGGNRPAIQQYLINTTVDSVRIWKMADPTPVSTSIYDAGQLYKTVTIDEGRVQTIVYKNNADRVVLKKVQLSDAPGTAHMGWLCTYYVYDDLGNLRVIIPPLAVERITSTWNVASVADELCFQYRFDAFNRMIEKKVPGAAVVEMVYDIRDRVAASRDGNLKANNQWLVNFYDSYNRVVETALYNSPSSRDVLQTGLNGSTGTGTTSYQVPGIANLVVAIDDRNTYVATSSVTLENGFDTGDGKEREIFIDPSLKGDIINLTVTNPLPGIAPGALTPLTYTYYDNYNYPGAQSAQSGDFPKPQPGNNPYPEPTTISTVIQGLITGTKVRVVDTDQWLNTTTYYDEKGKVFHVISDNAAGGKNVTTTLYDFNGKIL